MCVNLLAFVDVKKQVCILFVAITIGYEKTVINNVNEVASLQYILWLKYL